MKQKQQTRQSIQRTDPDPQLGLTQAQAKARVDAGWVNVSPKSVSRTEGEIIAANCLTFFNLVFGVLAVCLLLVGSHFKNFTFLVVVIINAVIGCVQEIRAKRAVDKLTLVAAQQLPVIRGGEKITIPDRELVIDDIVCLAPGDQISADAILRSGYLQVNEALVTGEEDLIPKKPGDRLLSGSFVVSGKGRAQLTAVGADAFAVKLSLEAKADPRAAKSEMMQALDKLIRFAGIALVPIGLILFFLEFQVLGLSLKDSVEDTVPALVGMIPEGLYLLTSIAMAASALKLTKGHVLVQDMNCIETLARVDVLCVDKTGTITESGMEVDNILPLSEETPERLERILTAFYAGADPENDTARAMQETFHGESDWQCIFEIPFNSQRKWSAKVFSGQGAFVIGAPEIMLGSRYSLVQETAEQWQSAGRRVLLAAAYDGEPKEDCLISERLRPLALLLLTNRIRPEAADTFAFFARQGVSIKVISGDNPVTVSEVARRAGIAGAEQYIDASTLCDEDYSAAVDTYTVFGRVTPDQKKKLIRALKEKGHTVAMTGDGVNDVLAMKEADCGIAMASGAQAASQVAQLVLISSDFSAMPGIVDEGRRVINNIQRAASLFLVKNIFSLGMALITLFSGWGYPIEAFHLTMISALTIGVPSFFLALEPNYSRVSGKFLRNVLLKALPGGLTNILVVLTAQACADVFGIAPGESATVCAAVLAAVGMLVLYRTSTPFTKLRTVIFVAMAVALLGSFTVLGHLFGLYFSPKSALVTLVLLVMAPTVFHALSFLLGKVRISR